MKKLTAGIFTVLLGLVAANSADAAVASKGYVDEMVGENTTAIETLGGTVDAHTQSITDLNAADNAINAKIGTVADGKTVVDLIADAKQEAINGVATYDDTEVRGLIAGKENSSNKVSAVSDDWSVEEQKQYYPTVYLTEQMIQSSTNDFATSIGDNATAIQNINNSAVMKSGITADKVTAYDGYAAKITANETAAAGAQAAAVAAQADADTNAAAIAAINNSESGFLKQAETAAKAYADGLAANYDAVGSADAAEAAAKAYADGLAGNYDTKGAAAAAETAAKSYADSLAANYDAKGSATQALTDAKAYADGLAANYDAKGAAATAKSEAISEAKSYADGVAATAKSEAIAAAKTAGDAAYDAKGAAEAAETAAIAAAKQAADLAYAAKSYEARVQANETAIAANTAAAEAAQQTADKAIPKPSGECADPDNKCVLTFNNAQYAWEVIERNDDGE